MQFKRSLGVGLLALSLLMAGCGSAPAPAGGQAPAAPAKKSYNLKFSMSVPESSPWTQGAMRMAKQVEEKSGGRIKISVFPNGTLAGGNQVKEFELLQNGTIDLTWHSSIILSSLDPHFIAFSLPWIAPTWPGLMKMIDGPGKQVWETALSGKGVVPLAYSSSGFRQLTNSKLSITDPGQLKGLKVRVPGIKMYQSAFQAMGADAVSTSFGELFGALQQGTVDGQENPISLIYSSKFYEVQKYLTLWNYSTDSIGILINQKVFNGMDPEAQQIIRDAAVAAAAWHRDAQDKADKDQLALLRQSMTVTELTPAQVQAFQKAMEPVYTEFEPVVGKQLLDSLRSVNK